MAVFLSAKHDLLYLSETYSSPKQGLPTPVSDSCDNDFGNLGTIHPKFFHHFVVHALRQSLIVNYEQELNSL
jgi:hypothetical protein